MSPETVPRVKTELSLQKGTLGASGLVCSHILMMESSGAPLRSCLLPPSSSATFLSSLVDSPSIFKTKRDAWLGETVAELYQFFFYCFVLSVKAPSKPDFLNPVSFLAFFHVFLSGWPSKGGPCCPVLVIYFYLLFQREQVYFNFLFLP